MLDAKGFKWEYEPEGFETPCGRYLPDFRVTFVPGLSVGWMEIKPDGFAVEQDDLGRWFSVARATDSMLIVACGLDHMTIVITPAHTYIHEGHPGFFGAEDIAAGKSARFEYGESG